MGNKILCVMMLLNILILLANVWLRIDSEKTLDEIKEQAERKTDYRVACAPRNDGGENEDETS